MKQRQYSSLLRQRLQATLTKCGNPMIISRRRVLQILDCPKMDKPHLDYTIKIVSVVMREMGYLPDLGDPVLYIKR